MLQEVLKQYQPLTATNRTLDFEIPQFIELGGCFTKIPDPLREKVISYGLFQGEGLKRTAWIHKSLAHTLNSARNKDRPNVSENEIFKAIEEIDKEIANLLKDHVLRDRQGPGAMSFSQAHECVPRDAILISERSYEALCAKSSRWRNTQRVLTVRFPNLGPQTTQSLRLIVDKKAPMVEGSLFFRLPELKELKNSLETEEVGSHGTIDAFYFHPDTLKGGFEGDGDGDLVFMVIDGPGKPGYMDADMSRSPGEITEEQIEKMISKSDRTERAGVADWLKKHLDVNLIGRATYIIRWETYKLIDKYKDDPHPMHSAWMEIAPQAIDLVEFIMDIRKGEFDEEEIVKRMSWIDDKNREISEARASGDWFTQTVLTQNLENVDGFLRKFPTLMSFVSFVTKSKKLTLEDFLEEEDDR